MSEIQTSRPRATMKEVAELAGTSLKTVSRVINGEAHVTPELTEKVKAAAAKLQFRPNLAAGFLRRSDGKTQMIGLLVENISNPFSATLHGAVEVVARLRDVVVFAGSLDENVEREHQLVDACIARRVDGLIIAPAADDHSYLVNEQKAGTPIVFLDRPPRNIEADSVLTDNVGGGKLATEHLIKAGHRRIAYVGDMPSIFTSSERLAGYNSALKAADIALEKKLVIQGDYSSEIILEAIRELLTSAHAPTAIFASQNFMTLAVIRILRQLGLHNEIALVGFDEISEADLLTPAITLVTQDVEAMGETAAELLFARLDGDTSPYKKIVLPTKITARGSGEIPPRK
jgi:LacI family transcriptional regulator